MAAKLQCEICGGKLIGKPGGVFECEYCGTEYSTEWAKAKIQEIKGTVKVEGTVEVKGSVQVEGTANAQSLVKRGNLALEDGKWDDAEKYFDEALNADPENAEAYLGKLMADLKVCRCEDLKKQALPFDENGNYKKAIRFGDETLKAELKGFVDTIYNRGAEKKQRQEDIKKITAAYQKELDDYNKKAEMVNQNRSVYVEKLFASKMNEFIKEAEEINRKKISEINETLTGLTAEKKEQESRFESLGVFKIKEKRELQANIDKLNIEITQAENEKNRVETEFSKENAIANSSAEKERSFFEMEAADRFPMPQKPEKPFLLVQAEQEEQNKKHEWAKKVAGKDIQSRILLFLGDGDLHTVSEMVKYLPGLSTFQYASAQVRRLMNEGLVDRVTVDRIQYFKLH